jgi:hypothetical protein
MEEQQEKLCTGDGGLLHGAAILKSLVLPCARTDKIVCANSYFALVGALQEFKWIELRFIGVVKTATWHFPQLYLSHLEMTEQGNRRGLIAKDEKGTPSMLAFCWMDLDHCYFITRASSLQPGRAYSRSCWPQISEVQNAEPERVNLQIPQPEAVELHYAACGMIDWHNRCQQDDQQLEKKLGTLDWSMRVNRSLLGMCIVDTWYAYSQCTSTREKQKIFYSFLAEELIDNNYDSVGPGSGQRSRIEDAQEAQNQLMLTNNGLQT